MHKPDIIVIGASAGGISVLKEIIKSLPKDLEASIFIVQHIFPQSNSILPEILNNLCTLKAIHPKDGAKIEKGTIYVAPAD